MCNPKLNSDHAVGLAVATQRPVLQPACNRIAALQASPPIKKSIQQPIPPNTIAAAKITTTNDASTAIKIVPNGLNSSPEKPMVTKPATRTATLARRKSTQVAVSAEFSFLGGRSSAGSIAAAQREQASLAQAQRKMRIAHYGRSVVPVDVNVEVAAGAAESQEEKRCSFITPNSDPLYIAYHDEEWGVPVHDDKMLFELLVLTGAQVGLDWTTILKKRNDFRAAFAGFDAEVLSSFSEKQIASISLVYGLDLGRVRGVINNANRILEVRRGFGSLDKYLWGFVNHKPITTTYKSGRKIPVKTSKSESISRDLRRRGFRFVGPTVVHSFMQAVGLTNDHLISCPRHPHHSSLSSSTTTTTTTLN